MAPNRTRLLVCLSTVVPAVAAPLVGLTLRKYDIVGANPQTFFALGILAGIALCGIALGLWRGAWAIGSGDGPGSGRSERSSRTGSPTRWRCLARDA